MANELALLGAGASGGGSAAFSPDQIAGLLLWLKADSLALNDGDPVGTWADSSGLGNNATQATASKKPTYKTSLQNGLPAVRFDGVDDVLNLTATLVSNTDWSVFVVYKKLAPGDVFLGLSNLTALSPYSTADWSDGELYINNGHEFYFGSHGGHTVATVALTRNTSGVLSLRLNAVDKTLNASTQDGASVFDCINARSGNQGKGDVFEILFYNSSLNSIDYQAIETYCNSKYAIF